MHTHHSRPDPGAPSISVTVISLHHHCLGPAEAVASRGNLTWGAGHLGIWEATEGRTTPALVSNRFGSESCPRPIYCVTSDQSLYPSEPLRKSETTKGMMGINNKKIDVKFLADSRCWINGSWVLLFKSPPSLGPSFPNYKTRRLKQVASKSPLISACRISRPEVGSQKPLRHPTPLVAPCLEMLSPP